jgi:hypothetical protein
MIKSLDMQKNVFRFAIKFFFERGDEGFSLSGMIARTKSVAKGASVEWEHRLDDKMLSW